MNFEPEPEKQDPLNDTVPSLDPIQLHPPDALSNKAFNRLNSVSAAQLLKAIHSEDQGVTAFNIESLPEETLERIMFDIFGPESDSIEIIADFKVTILAAVHIAEPVYNNWGDDGHYSVIVSIQDEKGRYWLPLQLGNGQESIELAPAQSRREFSGFLCQFEADLDDMWSTYIPGPAQTALEIDKICTGDLGGLIGCTLLESIQRSKINVLDLCSLSNFAASSQNKLSLIAHINSEQICAFIWGSDCEMMKRLEYCYPFQIDQHELFLTRMLEELPQYDYENSIIDGLDIQYGYCVKGTNPAIEKPDPITEISSELKLRIKFAIKERFPSQQIPDDFQIRYESVWKRLDPDSGETTELTFIVNILDSKLNLITPGMNPNYCGDAIVSGITVCVYNVKSIEDDNTTKDGQLIMVEALNLHTALWKEELLKLTSAKPDSSAIVYSLISNEIKEYCESNQIRPPNNCSSVLLTFFRDNDDHSYLGLYRTDCGDFMFRIEIEANGGILAFSEGLSIIDYFGKSRQVECFGHIDLKPRDLYE